MTSADQPHTQIRAIRHGQFRNDLALRDCCEAIAAPSYVAAREVLGREWARCDTLYLACGPDGPNAFYLTSFDIVEVDGQWKPTMYLGLSAARDSEKDRGLASQLYAHGVIDAMRWQHHEGEPLILWTTTATPLVYTMMRNHLIDVAPRPDGAYPTASARIAMAIRRELGPAYSCSSHPFVVKGLAKSTRYSQREIARLRQAKDRIDFLPLRPVGYRRNSR